MPAGQDTRRYILRLFISSRADAGYRAVEQVRRICERSFGAGNFKLDVIDVRQHPELAEEDKILATPTLVRNSPPPQCRLIGDFTDMAVVLEALGVGASPAQGTGGAAR